jgi:signal transduction histidine kinase
MTVMGARFWLRAASGGGIPGAIAALRVVGLGALLWAAANEHAADGAPAVPVPLLVMTALGWIGWLMGRRSGRPQRVSWVSLVVLAGAGGAVAGFAPVGIAFPAIAVLATAMDFDATPALVVAVVGALALAATVVALDAPRIIVAEGVLAILAAVLGGASRRQFHDRAAHAEALLAERARADAAAGRAAALAERNRIGREIHDVLAHSLGALSVQLDAADALVESGADEDLLRALLRQARRSAVEGLSEARAAVQALRDEPVALAEQLAALAAADRAVLTVTGAVRPLAADAGLALYRAAQEAVSNARKHAPGAEVSLRLTFDPDATVLIVTNGPCLQAGTAASRLSQSGGGLGLRGMRERVELLGGNVEAGPRDRGWTVQVAVPA